MRYLIRNGTIYNGGPAPPFQGDILTEGDKILEIASGIQMDNAEIIQADGYIVAPGFIDIHRHCDIAAIAAPEFGTLELAQGLTSAITGNCGLAPVPVSPPYRQAIYDFIEPCLGPMPNSFHMKDFWEYLEALDRAKPRINIGGLVAAGAVKAAVKGYAKTPFSPKEMDQARAHIREGMAAGAFGLSMGIMYSPECYSSTEELVSLAKAAEGGILTCHIRGEGDSLVQSVGEALRIAEEAQIPLEISHFKSTGIRNWHDKIFQAIELVEAARARGQDVTVDFYPYTGGSTTLLSLLPPSFAGETSSETIGKISGRMGREKLHKALDMDYGEWDNMVKSIGWDRILISSVTLEKNRDYPGKSLARIADEEGYRDPADFMCDLLAEEEGKVGIIVMSMAQEDVDMVAALPYSMLISDALYGSGSHPHPRLYGAFPRFIRTYVNERKLLTMETAIHKMTAMPADRLRLKGRGRLAPGNYADINLFQAQKFRDLATFSAPKQLSRGMDYVFVGGRCVWCEGKPLEERSATVLINR